MADVKQNIGRYQVGDTVSIVVDTAHNICTNFLEEVEMTLTIPSGMVYDSSNLERGTYDAIDDKWIIGGLTPGQKVEAEFTFEVTNECPVDYDFVFDLAVIDSCCDNCFTTPSYCVKVSGVSCCHSASCTDGLTNFNIYNTDGAQSDPVRTYDLSSQQLRHVNVLDVSWALAAGDYVVFNTTGGFMIDTNSSALDVDWDIGGLIDIVVSGDFSVNSNDDISLTASDELVFNTGSAIYKFVTPPGINNSDDEFIVRDSVGGILRRREASSFKDIAVLSHGDFANDAAAAGGGVPVGGHYYNTTTTVMHTRMT